MKVRRYYYWKNGRVDHDDFSAQDADFQALTDWHRVSGEEMSRMILILLDGEDSVLLWDEKPPG